LLAVVANPTEVGRTFARPCVIAARHEATPSRSTWRGNGSDADEKASDDLSVRRPQPLLHGIEEGAWQQPRRAVSRGRAHLGRWVASYRRPKPLDRNNCGRALFGG
jgi:hypothetical protein